ncbi:hypothetical protein [Streptomyces litchfieldiae]|uniref:Uncharacterized protein n=1 Tax=Streptomyces litchfieldiae TaxID=3075543 RepID=A0ABU2MPS5_9ACTN|nr:hypothetical protein [Streptomyces sp. DSM 44938]MDT0343627.1 hypothetical protein [Streptomyces sp. DSM 44938]
MRQHLYGSPHLVAPAGGERGPAMTDTVHGTVAIEYRHFCVTEGGPGTEAADFRSERPVILSHGRITVTTRVQEQRAPVTVRVVRRHTPPEGWAHLGTVTYRPVHRGVVTVCDTMNGPAMDDLRIDPATVYGVHVYAKGRADSRERFDACLDRGEYGVRDGFEEYLIVFVPSGSQEPPEIREERRMVVDDRGRRPANLR